MSLLFSLLAMGITPELPLVPVVVSGMEVPRISLWCGPDSEIGGIYLVEFGHSPIESIFRVSAIQMGTGKPTVVLDTSVGAEGNMFVGASGKAVIQSATDNALATINIESGKLVGAKFEFKDGHSVSTCLQVPNMTAGQNK